MSGGTMSGRVERLPELDERRAELVQHLSQVLAPLGRRAVRRHARPAREEVGQAVRLEEVTEAVLDRDLCDLGEPSEVPRRRARHGFSVTREQAVD
jgi:hypothetical protein